MDFVVNLAAGFMNLFTLGGETFVSWVTGIIPKVLLLLILKIRLLTILFVCYDG